MASRATLRAALILSLSAFPLAAQEVPVVNWEVPRLEIGKLATGERTVFAAITPPCRLSDSRVSSGGPGPIPGSGSRTYDFVPGGSTGCGTLPSNVVALSLFFTVVGPAGPGFIFAYPAGQPPASPVSIINYSSGDLRNNAAIVPVDAAGAFTVTAGVSATDLIIDINGVFYSDLGTDFLSLRGTGFTVIEAINDGSGAVRFAVHGQVNSDDLGYAVVGSTNTSSETGSAGVLGISQGILFPTPPLRSGVLGAAQQTPDVGVLGLGTYEGVRGINTDGSGNVEAFGALGWDAVNALYGSGNLLVTGMKSFVEPHPTQAGREIAYVSLEGPEAGVYFRGRGKFDRGLARIEVPESFRLVAAEEGLGVQITPIGEMASVAVIQASLDGIVVKSSRNVEFYYTVNGVRKSFPDFEPIRDSAAYVPRSERETLATALAPEQKARLIRNGTFYPDGTVNRDTAKRLGWDRKWSKPETSPPK
jgi:hypothetical protein